LLKLVSSNLPLRYFGISQSDVAAMKQLVFRFLREKPAPRESASDPTWNQLSSAVKNIIEAEAAQLFATGFEFFFNNVSAQVTIT
jgi:hypothetical protein